MYKCLDFDLWGEICLAIHKGTIQKNLKNTYTKEFQYKTSLDLMFNCLAYDLWWEIRSVIHKIVIVKNLKDFHPYTYWGLPV